MRRLLALTFVVAAACTGTSDPTTDDASPTQSAAVSENDSEADETTAADDPPAESDDESTNVAADGSGLDCDQIDRATLVRSRSIAGGRQLHLSLLDNDGQPVPDALPSACLGIQSERLGDLEVVTSESPRSEGATLIVAHWTQGAVDTSRALIDELLATLPPTDRVAVWAWSDELLQVVGATTDRDLVDRRLDAVWTGDDAIPLDPASAAEIAAEEWEDYADDVLLGLRSVVFVAPELKLGERPDIDRDVVTDYWIVGSGEGGRVEALVGTEPEIAAAAVADRIQAAGDGPLTVVQFCDDGGELDLTVLSGTEELRTVGVGDAAVEHVGAACDIAALGTPGPEALPSIDVTFDADQRASYDEAVAIADELSGIDRFDSDIDPEWTGNISFDGGITSAPFEASFRGQSSIECERRNWSIDLEGGDARHPIAGTGSDEFILASLCNDVGYVNTLVGSAVMAEFGLWSFATGSATFNIDDKSLGVYLVVENPETDLRAETSRVESVLRRRYDVLGVAPDVKYVADQTSNDDASVIAEYDELVAIAEATSGDEMVAALRARFDLDQYLRWTAVMSLLGSGDHIDELFFTGEQTVNADHDPVTWFTVNGWDPDDLYAVCHRNGRFEIDDPNGLLSCTESLLDQQLFADATVYGLFVSELEGVIETITVERFEQISSDAALVITQQFDDPVVVAAMVELDPPTDSPDVAREAVQSAAAGLTSEFIERRSTLLDLIATYRSTN